MRQPLFLKLGRESQAISLIALVVLLLPAIIHFLISRSALTSSSPGMASSFFAAGYCMLRSPHYASAASFRFSVSLHTSSAGLIVARGHWPAAHSTFPARHPRARLAMWRCCCPSPDSSHRYSSTMPHYHGSSRATFRESFPALPSALQLSPASSHCVALREARGTRSSGSPDWRGSSSSASLLVPATTRLSASSCTACAPSQLRVSASIAHRAARYAHNLQRKPYSWVPSSASAPMSTCMP